MITVVAWKWQQKYRHSFSSEHVNVLERMVRRHYDGDLRFICVTDNTFGIRGETYPLWGDFKDTPNPHGATEYPSCFRRLKLFDPDTQAAMGIAPGERIVSLDLDVVVIDDLNTLWDRNESFVGWAVKNKANGHSFNGSMWMLRAGEHADVWDAFDPIESPREANRLGYLGSDQAWMSYCLADSQAGWDEGDGIYTRMQTLKANGLPSDARIVMFHGPVKPWDAVQNGTPGWVGRHWK